MRWLPRHPVTGAGLTFLGFAPVELITGHIVQNTAITSNAAHDAFDGIFFLVFAYLDNRLRYARSHSLYCRGRHLLSLAAALLAVVIVALGFAIEQANDDGWAQLIAAVTLGPISFGLNTFWERRLSHVHDHDNGHDHGHDAESHHGISAHLLGDMAGAVLVTISGVLAYVLTQPSVNSLCGGLIVGVTAVIATMKIRPIVRALRHRADQHDHVHEPPDIHAAHTSR